MVEQLVEHNGWTRPRFVFGFRDALHDALLPAEAHARAASSAGPGRGSDREAQTRWLLLFRACFL